MKRLGFNSKLLLCLLMLCARPFGAARAQESIDIGAEVWIEPGQTPEQIDGWFSLAANNGMRSVRLFLMWNYIEKTTRGIRFLALRHGLCRCKPAQGTD